jgi:hypothetical protein
MDMNMGKTNNNAALSTRIYVLGRSIELDCIVSRQWCRA